MDAELQQAIARINQLTRTYDDRSLVKAWNIVRSQLCYLEDAARAVLDGHDGVLSPAEVRKGWAELRKAVRGIDDDQQED